MSVNAGLAHVSTDFMIAALLIYSVSLLAFAGDYAFGRPRRKAITAAAPVAERTAQLAAVGATSAGAAPAGAAVDPTEPDASAGPDATVPGAAPATAAAGGTAGPAVDPNKPEPNNQSETGA